MKKKIQTQIFLISIVLFISSCAVQQFPVNTAVKPFEYGGRVFGEKTKGKEFKKGHDFFLIGINISKTNTKLLAEKINATSYTVESKQNWLGALIYYCSYGSVDYKIVKVIKRPN